MNYYLKNNFLQVEVASKGGELQSIRTPDGTEYLWQGNPEFWSDRALNIFPYVARLTQNTYIYEEKPYHMDIHGFLKDTDLLCESKDSNHLCLYMEDNENTRPQYPFSFLFSITYTLNHNQLQIEYQIRNKGDKTMYFGLGGHPGFNVPLHPKENFEDYYLQFDPDCSPKHVIFTDDCFVTGQEKEFLLHHDNTLPLSHTLFDNDAIVLKDTGSKIILRTHTSSHSVEINCKDFAYLGLWHTPKTQAPYICIEPWSSLPSRKEKIEKLETQDNLLTLAPGSMLTKEWSITVHH